MQRIEAIGQQWFAPIHGQRVLGQVVGTDREKVHDRGQPVGDKGSGRRLDHDAQMHALAPWPPGADLLDYVGDVLYLLDAAHHRHHNA